MNSKDYDHTHHYVKCGGPVRIRVKHPLSVVLVMQHWHDKLGGLCKKCLKKRGGQREPDLLE